MFSNVYRMQALKIRLQTSEKRFQESCNNNRRNHSAYPRARNNNNPESRIQNTEGRMQEASSRKHISKSRNPNAQSRMQHEESSQQNAVCRKNTAKSKKQNAKKQEAERETRKQKAAILKIW